MKKLLILAEYGFTILSLLHYSGGPLALLFLGGASQGDIGVESIERDNTVIIILFFLNYLVTFFLLVARWKNVVRVLSKDGLIWLLIGIPLFSLIWAVNPQKTIIRCLAIFGTSLFGLYLATRYTLKQQLKLLACTFGLAILLSIVFAVALPKYGIMGGTHTGSLRGIYTHKNVLGKMFVISNIVFLVQAIDTKKNAWLMWLGLGFSAIFVLLSRSASSLLNLGILVAALTLLPILRWNFKRIVPAVSGIATIGISLYIWFIYNAEKLLALIGKDTTLTGRSDLWPLVLNAIAQRPWLGYGYGGFWDGWQSEGGRLWYAAGWNPPNSHNGFLDLWLQLGILGVAVFAISFFSTLLRSLTLLRSTTSSEALWLNLYLIYTILSSVTESSLMVQNDLIWVLYVTVFFSALIATKKSLKFAQVRT